MWERQLTYTAREGHVAHHDLMGARDLVHVMREVAGSPF